MRGREPVHEQQVGAELLGTPSLMAAAHELKQPLALIRQLSLGLEAGDLTTDQQQILRQILLTSERGLRLTTDLTRASRLEDALFELEPLNPQHLLEDIAHELTPLYKAKDRELRVRTRRRPILAVANRDLLRRVILSFADNALIYADVTAPVELATGLQRNGRGVRIAVRDHGPLIERSAWQQLARTIGVRSQPLHARPASSGLGLLIAGQFANVMHGQVGTVRHHDGMSFFIDLDASTQLSLL